MLSDTGVRAVCTLCAVTEVEAAGIQEQLAGHSEETRAGRLLAVGVGAARLSPPQGAGFSFNPSLTGPRPCLRSGPAKGKILHLSQPVCTPPPFSSFLSTSSQPPIRPLGGDGRGTSLALGLWRL